MKNSVFKTEAGRTKFEPIITVSASGLWACGDPFH